MSSRGLSKRELEELKKKEEEEAAAHVFKEFVETFQEAPTASKVWIKAGTYDAGARKEDTTEKGKLYKPTSRFEDKRSSAEDLLRSFVQRQEPSRSKSKLSKDKKKSNLELFKEELRQIQEERSERHKYKNVLRDKSIVEPIFEPFAEMGSYDNGDPNTTNLYLGNLSPKVTEQQLMEIFGRHGPLASIKIMWPRSDEEKARGRNCGFVAYMSRKDGERALKHINGKEIGGYEMKLGWGKAVVIPPVPIYIPPALLQPSQPPPPSGLPFNAQPPKHLAHKIPRMKPGEYYPSDPEDAKLFDHILSQSVVRVVMPTERNILMLIHRMVEFVIREGPMFEAVIMNKEINNSFFRFLFENQSPAHVYYRWRLYSMLQGDTSKQWSPEDFRMFKGGSIWRPPVMNLYTGGMPDELFEEEEAKESMRGSLSNNQRDRLEDIIRNLTANRDSIAAAMAWCLEHAEAADEVAQCLTEALSGENTTHVKRIARLYLLSDILHNSSAKLTNASAYRMAFEQRLPEIMLASKIACEGLSSHESEGFKSRVIRVLQAWADWAIYSTEYLIQINEIFSGSEKCSAVVEPETNPSGSPDGWGEGALDGAALRRLAQREEADIDGVPVDEDIDGVPLEAEPEPSESITRGGFVPSKWESVEPEEVLANAVTTNMWNDNDADQQDTVVTPQNTSVVEDQSLSRETLRQIEVKVLKYGDELEAGERQRKTNMTALQQIQHYRRKLMKKALKEAKEAELLELRETPERRRSPEDDTYSNTSKKSKKSREVSLSPPPKRYKHLERRSRSRSRERDRERSREYEREREREKERERRRRSPTTPPSHHHRKHKHAKHKY